MSLYKPLLILSGISGTGKTRFVREQAKNSSIEDTYKLIPVRPDWHEPSDLLGYVSRLSKNNKPKYVISEVLQFIVKAWVEIFEYSSPGVNPLHLDNIENVRPYWLCLDEMNLAPIEQYFADYLSVLETRQWSPRNPSERPQVVVLDDDWTYSCDPLISLQMWNTEDPAQDGKHILDELRKDLGLNEDKFERLWNHFKQFGISIPFNLIVVGTVNMDDTTHGFSRKVLDRAVVMDFLEFFPTNFDTFFGGAKQFQPLTYPTMSNAQLHEEAFEVIPKDSEGNTEDNDGSNQCIDVKKSSIEFLQMINKILIGTPFELSYRAMNELLLAVLLLKPQTEQGLYAVWDDFLMQKVLPRIEGDGQKLLIVPEGFSLLDDSDEQNNSSNNILEEIEKCLKKRYSIEYSKDKTEQREDFYRITGKLIPWWSPQKIKAMTYRLAKSRFTSFWT
ncbi:MAG: restriction endonuclease [Proteobacteria bacterium]|nr:restriction endonuclease [Pseudomonadota bacterium]